MSTLQSYAAKHGDQFDLRLYVDVLDDKAIGLPNLTMGLIGRPAIERVFAQQQPATTTKTSSSSSWLGGGQKQKQKEPEAPKPSPKKTLFLISGPEQCVSYPWDVVMLITDLFFFPL